MNKAMPEIKESVAVLRGQLRHETNGQRKQRVQMLYLLASGQATTRSAVAQQLGVHRNTVGAWLCAYEAGGLRQLLHVAKPPGRRATLNAAQMTQLREALARPQGFASYKEVQRWIAQSLEVAMPYKTVYHLVRYLLGAKLKRPRPTHVKKK